MMMQQQSQPQTFQQPQQNSAPGKTGLGKFAVVGGGLALVFVVAMMFKPKKQFEPVAEHQDYESHSCIGEMTDKQRREFMREMGKRGAAKRWGNKVSENEEPVNV